MYVVWCWKVQDEQRKRRVHRLWGEHVFDDGGRKHSVNVSGVPFEHEFAKRKCIDWFLYLQPRIHRARRICVLGMCRQQVQDDERECSVHVMPCELEFSKLKYIH